MDKPGSAPVFEVADRDIIAVEHPMIFKNSLENGLKTFGIGSDTTGQPFKRVTNFEDTEGCIPLYLRYNDPMAGPILSHNCPTTNVLLKITVPKRTGRKRKRGSQDQYSEDINAPSVSAPMAGNLRSHSRLDKPVYVLRSLKENIGKYEVEAVAEIERTHRFRGLADFHYATSGQEFVPKFVDLVWRGSVNGIDSMRDFKFNPSMGPKKNEDLVPPPAFTNQPLPYNWAWQQNPNVAVEIDKVTGESKLVNRSRQRKLNIEYLRHDAAHIPQNPLSNPLDAPQGLQQLVESLKIAFDERPVWTRRALANRMGDHPHLWLLKPALQYVAYQFKGGPFREAAIKFGIDPRKDPEYRKYQTIFFKLYVEERGPFRKWMDSRGAAQFTRTTRLTDLNTHIFDGKSLTLDGKVWQICDITEPFLVQMIEAAPVCTSFKSNGDGWFYNGSWAKIRAVMKMKLAAIRTGKVVNHEDWMPVLNSIPDIVDNNMKTGSHLHVPLPGFKYTKEELEELQIKEGLGRAVLIDSTGNPKIDREEHIQGYKDRKRARRKTTRRERLLASGKKPGPPRPRKKKYPLPSMSRSLATSKDQDAGSGTGNPEEGVTEEGEMESVMDYQLLELQRKLGVLKDADLEAGESESELTETDVESDELGSDEDEEDDEEYDSDGVDYSAYYQPRRPSVPSIPQ